LGQHFSPGANKKQSNGGANPLDEVNASCPGVSHWLNTFDQAYGAELIFTFVKLPIFQMGKTLK
jgi:hypothetical protein